MLVAVVRHIAYFEGEYSLFQVCIGCFQVSLAVLSVLPAVYSNFLQNTSLLWPGVTFSDVLFATNVSSNIHSNGHFSLFHTSHGLKACSLVESGQWEPVKHERSCKQVLLENGADRVGCDSGLWAGCLLKGKSVVCFSAPLFCWFPFMVGKELAVLYGTG